MEGGDFIFTCFLMSVLIGRHVLTITVCYIIPLERASYVIQVIHVLYVNSFVPDEDLCGPNVVPLQLLHLFTM